MTAVRYVALRCNGPECGAEIHHPYSDCITVSKLRRIRRVDGWRQRPAGRDICPDCWKAGHR
ncbi:hypothetical protein [Streptomyces bugieae]|uniref:Uncharacterized protein n=1 Tax=Streptomyces bugieae TaxID=3098223 RepID=A0ABU7NL28_9ACTN|nr:hypothetical protein [Streptomyces sp. DSM 41528]